MLPFQVRTALNQQRNYAGTEFRDFHVDIFAKGEEDQWPNKDDILEIVLRNGMEDGDDTEDLYLKKAAKVWDVLMVKVAGVEYW